jgi:hypothetical protein
MKVREVVEIQLHAFLTALLSVEGTAVSTAWEAGWPPGSVRIFRIREQKSLLLVGNRITILQTPIT